MTYWTWIESPLGRILLTSDGASLTGLHFEGDKYFPPMEAAWIESPHAPILTRAANEVREYFRGARSAFDVPMNPAGTPFQRRVWRALGDIAFGATVSYAQVAGAIGAPRSTRAVGAAIGRNPISIMVPCHRVVGSDGALTGYAGGLDKKAALLALEGHNAVASRRAA